MTIERGQDWGRETEVPPDLVVSTNDARTCELVAAGRAVAAVKGDVAVTLGSRVAPKAGSRGRKLPVDLLDVMLRVGGEPRRCVAVAHVEIGQPWWRGGRWRGAAHFVMNTGHWRSHDIVPRGHPNDGRFEVMTVSAGMSARQRWLAWRRSVLGTHLPHPGLSVSSLTETSFAGRHLVVRVDGRRVRGVSEVEVRVRPDAGWLWM